MTEVIVDNKLQSNLNSLIENTLEQEKRMEEDLDFFFNNNTNQAKRKKKKESTRRKKSNLTTQPSIKSRNFLTNILYGWVKEDLFDGSFVFDVYVLTTKKDF